MTPSKHARADEPTAATVAALLIGIAIGLGIGMFMAAMHAAGQGRSPW